MDFCLDYVLVDAEETFLLVEHLATVRFNFRSFRHHRDVIDSNLLRLKLTVKTEIEAFKKNYPSIVPVFLRVFILTRCMESAAADISIVAETEHGGIALVVFTISTGTIYLALVRVRRVKGKVIAYCNTIKLK